MPQILQLLFFDVSWRHVELILEEELLILNTKRTVPKLKKTDEALQIIINCLNHLVGLVAEEVKDVILKRQQINGNNIKLDFCPRYLHYTLPRFNFVLSRDAIEGVQSLKMSLMHCE